MSSSPAPVRGRCESKEGRKRCRQRRLKYTPRRIYEGWEEDAVARIRAYGVVHRGLQGRSQILAEPAACPL